MLRANGLRLQPMIFQGWKFKLWYQGFGQFGYFKSECPQSTAASHLPRLPWSPWYWELFSSFLQPAVGWFSHFSPAPPISTPSNSQEDALCVAQIWPLLLLPGNLRIFWTQHGQILEDLSCLPGFRGFLLGLSPVTNSHTGFLICIYLGSSALHDQFPFVL